MAKYLVIVESPAKAKTIGKFLGKNYHVQASIGHVRDLPKSKMGIDIENDFEPNYITIRGKGEVIKGLRKEVKKAEKVYLATDPDREGEAIAWHLKQLLQKDDKPFQRIAFNAITKDAVKSAIKSGRDVDMSLVDAQQARRSLDRLVGYSISPILWRKIRRGLSAGRVQSVATRMICDREREITEFVGEEYWTITGHFEKHKDKFKADFYGVAGKKVKLSSADDVAAVRAKLNGDYRVTDLKRVKRTRNPLAPFITSTLQQEAAGRFGFSTKKTMMLAQQLYEGVTIKRSLVGLITYMRTDSTRLAPEASADIYRYIEEHFGEQYKGAQKRGKAAKGAQEAHEAIRPTQIDLTPDAIASYLKPDQLKLYKLIWERAVASHMASALFEQLNVQINCGEVIFKTTGSKRVFDGFMRVYSFAKSNDVLLPDLIEGEVVDCKKIEPEQHFTQPPSRYSEASLVKAMEEEGIGRPSTYAPTISTILSRGYVAKEKKALYPTELGLLTNNIMMTYFDDVINVAFTAELEKKLDAVEGDAIPWKQVIKEFYNSFKPDLEKADEELERIELVEETDEVCEECGAPMVIKYGRYGKFLACSKYPECTHTRPILDRIGVTCPQCKKGDVIARKTKKYKTFYGCSAFPDCRFMSWYRPTGESCPQCQAPLVDYKTKKKHEIRCTNKDCSYAVPVAE